MRLPEFFRTFSETNYAKLVDSLNALFEIGLTLADNFSGQIITVELTAGVERKIPHRLKAVPKYRIILRQDANTVIYDGSEWKDSYITLNAASNVTVTFLLMRG